MENIRKNDEESPEKIVEMLDFLDIWRHRNKVLVFLRILTRNPGKMNDKFCISPNHHIILKKVEIKVKKFHISPGIQKATMNAMQKQLYERKQYITVDNSAMLLYTVYKEGGII